jgi:Domain of unknown function (DUF4145)
MMNSWWELGEGIGFEGGELALWRIACAFCNEKGNFTLVFHEEKKNPNSQRCLNFDVYKCVNCAGFVHVLWSGTSRGFGRGMHNFRILPWALSAKPEPSEAWPDGMKRFWIQAHDSLANENWDAATVMARSALQFVVRDKKAMGAKLKVQVDDLVAKGVLHPLMKDWAEEVRLLANESAHPEAPDPIEVSSQDSNDIVNFPDLLLFFLYDLPEQIEQYRQRKKP